MSLILSGTEGISGSAGVIDAETFAGQANTYYTDISARLGYTPLSNVNPSYSGTLTGNTGIINIGSGQFYKDANGKVGIGTTSPLQKVEVASSGVSYIRSRSTDSAFTGVDFGQAATGSGRIIVRDNQPLEFYTATTEWMRITSGGNVGIGTSSPEAKLDVSGGDALIHGITVGRGGGFQQSSTAIGLYSLGLNTSGTNNTAVGNSTLTSNQGGANNTAVGLNVLRSNSNGNNNTGIGTEALFNNTSGGNNTAVGFESLYSVEAGGNNNVAVGYRAGRNITTGSGNTILGVDIFGSATLTNTVLIGSGGTERMRIDSSGNVGIGVTPINKFDVLGGTNTGGFFRNADVTAVGAAGMLLLLGALSGSTLTAGAAVGAQLDNPATTGALQFYTRTGDSLTEKVRITSSGNVVIGAISAGYTTTNRKVLTISGGTGGTEGAILSFAQAGSNKGYLFSIGNNMELWCESGQVVIGTAAASSISLKTSNIERLSISSAGAVTIAGALSAASITETSSITYKENVNPIMQALDAIVQLTGVTYDRKDGSRTNEAGLIAEEVNKVLPNIVTKNDEGNPEGIQYTKLTAYLIECIKELKSEIDILKGK
jgi:hypothetical protein